MATTSTYDSNGKYAAELIEDGIFTEADIATAIAGLTDYERYENVAWANVPEAVPPPVLKAFTALAEALHGEITLGYGQLNVRKQRSAEDLRRNAIAKLKS
jgi:hypothetical protein